jgi:hypothetical protein
MRYEILTALEDLNEQEEFIATFEFEDVEDLYFEEVRAEILEARLAHFL